MAQKTQNTLNTNVDLPFQLSYKRMLGGKLDVCKKNNISYLELKTIVNVATILRKNQAKVAKTFTISIGNHHGGHYQVEISETQFKYLNKVIEEVESVMDNSEQEIEA